MAGQSSASAKYPPQPQIAANPTVLVALTKALCRPRERVRPPDQQRWGIHTPRAIAEQKGQTRQGNEGSSKYALSTGAKTVPSKVQGAVAAHVGEA